jgi:uncharacterized spore protein YtfJ
MATKNEEPNGSTASLIEGLGEELSRNGTVKVVFADPVEKHGVIVIPVAKIKYGFGGRDGTGHNGQRPRTGGGGRMRATPLGYIEVKNGSSKFRPVFDPISMARLVLGGLILGLWAASRVSRR